MNGHAAAPRTEVLCCGHNCSIHLESAMRQSCSSKLVLCVDDVLLICCRLSPAGALKAGVLHGSPPTTEAAAATVLCPSSQSQRQRLTASCWAVTCRGP